MSLKTTNERVALEKKKKLEALDVIGQLSVPSKTPIVPFLQSFCEFLKKTRTRKSAKNDISYLRSFFGPCCTELELGSNVPHKFRRPNQDLPLILDKQKDRHIPIKLLEQISTEMVSRFIQDRLTHDGIKPKTANRIREVLHRMFSYAIEHHGYICPDKKHSNPIKGVKRIKEAAPAITWLTLEQIDEQLSVLESYPTIHVLVSVYIYAGLRREEALWLTSKDVDLNDRLLRIQAKTVDGHYWQPKTKKNRVVPISDSLYRILLAYKSRCDSKWFFPSLKGGMWDPDNFSQKLRKINKESSLDWSCLDFRHTFGSHLAQKGESLYKIAELMGNSPEICRRHYAALIPEKMKDVVEFSVKEQSNVNDGATKELLEEILGVLKGKDQEIRNIPHLKLVHFDESA